MKFYTTSDVAVVGVQVREGKTVRVRESGREGKCVCEGETTSCRHNCRWDVWHCCCEIYAKMPRNNQNSISQQQLSVKCALHTRRMRNMQSSRQQQQQQQYSNSLRWLYSAQHDNRMLQLVMSAAAQNFTMRNAATCAGCVSSYLLPHSPRSCHWTALNPLSACDVGELYVKTQRKSHGRLYEIAGELDG